MSTRQYNKNSTVNIKGKEYIDIDELSKQLEDIYPIGAPGLRRLARTNRIPSRKILGGRKYWFLLHEVVEALGTLEYDLKDEDDLAGL